MKLRRARVLHYKSINDSGWVALAPLTCLVGKNESGKTAFLEALQKLNPGAGERGDFDLVDYPLHDFARYKKTHTEHPTEGVQAEFALTDAEVQELEGVVGAGVLRSRTVTVSKNYHNVRAWQVEVDEQAALRPLLVEAGLPAEISQQVQHATTGAEATALLEEVAEQRPDVDPVLPRLRERGQPSFTPQLTTGSLDRWLPRFAYFSEYHLLPDRIALAHFRQRCTQGTLAAAERTFVALLGLAGLDVEDLEHERSYLRLKPALEVAASRITDEVLAFWSQSPHLRVSFDLAPADPTDPPPLNTGTILHVRVWDERHRLSVPFGARSHGFVWFFSFLVYFSQLQSEATEAVLLLDEPGLSLHPTAQADLLRFLEERVAPHYQVLYTTHSPFLLNPAHLERVRTVQDIEGEGTRIGESLLSLDRETLVPLQAALGYALLQPVVREAPTVLVESPAEVIYLQVLSEALGAKGRPRLDPRWQLIPMGGPGDACDVRGAGGRDSVRGRGSAGACPPGGESASHSRGAAAPGAPAAAQ